MPAVTRYSRSLYQVRGWMRFAGILLIIQGVITALTIVGLLFAWIPIWMGLLLRKGAARVEEAFESEEPAALKEGLQKISTYFKIMGIMSLIMVIVFAIGVLVGVLLPLLGMRQMTEGME